MAGKLRAEIARLGLERDVFLPGYVKHPEDLLLAAQVAVLPSWREAMGLFLLEAMAMGKAIVATKVGGIPEAVGDCGLLVPAKDPRSLAAALKTLLASEALRRELGSKSFLRWQDMFSARKMGERTAAVYDEVLQETAR